MITLTELNNLSYEELRNLSDLIGAALRTKQSVIARQFKIGDLVRLRGRAGNIEGKVTKINPKSIKVDCGLNGQWKCSPSLLSLVE